MTWAPDRGGCRISLQQIQASCGAFAAVLDDGSVVTWGHADWGGDSSAVQGELMNTADGIL